MKAEITVWVNGVLQAEHQDYDILDNYTVKFIHAPSPGAMVVIDSYINTVNKNNSTYGGTGTRKVFGLTDSEYRLEEKHINVDKEYWYTVSLRRDLAQWFKELCADSEGREWYEHEKRGIHLHDFSVCMSEPLYTILMLKCKSN